MRVEGAALGFIVWLFGIQFLVVECCHVGDVFFLLTNLDPNFGVTHVGIEYCIIPSDVLICIQILLRYDVCWN